MKNKTIDIIFVLPTLQAGGAERVVSFIAQNLDKKKFNVELLITGEEEKNSYSLDTLKLTYLNKKKVRHSVFALIKHFLINRPKIIFSTLSHLNIVIAYISTLFPWITFVARETYIRSNTKGYTPYKTKGFDRFIESSSFKLFDYIICQSADMLRDTKSEFQINEKKLKIIRNPITDNFKLKDNPPIIDNKIDYNFITVGRLANIKGHNRILNVLSNFNKPYTYTIIGDGPLEKKLKQKIKVLGLNDKIKFVEFTKNVTSYLSNNDFFLQGSYTEGFPNAILESCAVGTPVIAFDAPGGTKEIIEDGINGFLVQDEDDFLQRLNNLPNLDPKTVSESVFSKFDKKIILREYEEFFESIIRKK